MRLPSFKLDENFEKLLSSIPDFDFDTDKGYLNWNYGRTDSGVVRYPCSSIEFREWQSRVIKKNPEDFNDLEEVLL